MNGVTKLTEAATVWGIAIVISRPSVRKNHYDALFDQRLCWLDSVTLSLPDRRVPKWNVFGTGKLHETLINDL